MLFILDSRGDPTINNKHSVVLSRHALEKMNSRNVSLEEVKETIVNPESLFQDAESNALIAVKLIQQKYVVVIYTMKGSTAKIITVYHSSEVDRLIRRKVLRRAWLEKRRDSLH